MSLESAKLVEILKNMGHASYFCAGELENDGPSCHLVPQMRFNHPEIVEIQSDVFREKQVRDVQNRINKVAVKLKNELNIFVNKYNIEVLFTQNVQSLPMNLPLGVALREFIAENSFPTIAHHHDFWWERERYLFSQAEELLESYFPPHLDFIRHIVINSIARDELKRRKGISATVLPNVFDFSKPASGIDEFNKDLRSELGLEKEEIFFLQPTRVVPRKGIEQSIRLIAHLSKFSNKLFITHQAGDEGTSYLERLRAQASSNDVDLRYVAGKFGSKRSKSPQKRYSLWDAYIHADFVTYPSLKEGFGNALLETIYFRLPALVNRYPVYIADIAPLGFDFIEMEQEINSTTIEKTKNVLTTKELRSEMVEHNFNLAEKHFSYQQAEKLLEEIIYSLEI